MKLTPEQLANAIVDSIEEQLVETVLKAGGWHDGEVLHTFINQDGEPEMEVIRLKDWLKPQDDDDAD